MNVPYLYDPMQPYRNRDYQLHRLDSAVFEALNEGINGCFVQVSGCLDALDSIPAGSCTSSPHGSAYGPSYITRGVSLKEIERRNAIAQRILEEIE